MNTVLKRIVLFASSKGGVGRTLAATAVSDLVRNDLGLPVALYDADGRDDALSFYMGALDENRNPVADQNPMTGVRCSGRDLKRTATDFIECMETGAERIFFDTDPDCLNELRNAVDGGKGLSSLFDAYSKGGYRLTIAHLMTGDIHATLSFSRWAKECGPHADHVLLWNQHFQGCKNNQLMAESGMVPPTVLPGIPQIEFPEIPSDTFFKIAVTRGPLSFKGSANAAGFEIVDKSRIRCFRRTLAEKLKASGAAPLFGIPT